MVQHTRPLVHWYGFPFVWLAGPEPANLFSQPFRNGVVSALLIDMACLVGAPLAVRYTIGRVVRCDTANKAALHKPLFLVFNLREFIWSVACYSLMCAVWLNPRWCFLCENFSCRFVINRGLLGSFAYLPLVLPAVLFSSIGLAVLLELSLTRLWNSWHQRRRPRLRPTAAEVFGT